MPENVTQKPAHTMRCDRCGAVHKNLPWQPGDPCPKCGAEALTPVVMKIGSDYAKADRSTAFALEDIRFGRLAQWAGLVTPKQVQFVLHKQNQMARSGMKVPDIGSILLGDKLITRQQHDAILAARRTKPGTLEDTEFAQAAIQLGAVTREQVEECQRTQERLYDEGRDPPPLPLLMLEKRRLQENQVLALLKASERQGRGLLRRVTFAETQRPSSAHPVMDKVLGPSDSPHRKLRLALLLVLPPLLLVLWYQMLAPAPETATVKCMKPLCRAEGGAPASTAWPGKCAECGEKSTRPMAMCRDCGTRFPVLSGLGYGTACPKCRSSKYIMITDRNAEEIKVIQDAIKNKKKEPVRRGDREI